MFSKIGRFFQVRLTRPDNVPVTEYEPVRPVQGDESSQPKQKKTKQRASSGDAGSAGDFDTSQNAMWGEDVAQISLEALRAQILKDAEKPLDHITDVTEENVSEAAKQTAALYAAHKYQSNEADDALGLSVEAKELLGYVDKLKTAGVKKIPIGSGEDYKQAILNAMMAHKKIPPSV